MAVYVALGYLVVLTSIGIWQVGLLFSSGEALSGTFYLAGFIAMFGKYV